MTRMAGRPGAIGPGVASAGSPADRLRVCVQAALPPFGHGTAVTAHDDL